MLDRAKRERIETLRGVTLQAVENARAAAKAEKARQRDREEGDIRAALKRQGDPGHAGVVRALEQHTRTLLISQLEDPAEIRAQIKGSDDAGGAGWMLWNPRNRYTGAALEPKGSLAAR